MPITVDTAVPSEECTFLLLRWRRGITCLLLVGGPFLRSTAKMMYNLGFIVSLTGTALWLTVAAFLQ